MLLYNPLGVQGSESPSFTRRGHPYHPTTSEITFKDAALAFSSEKEEEFYQLENDLIKIIISNKGGQIIMANLKKFDNYLKEPLNLVDNNQTTDLVFKLKGGRKINTSKLSFQINENKSKKSQLVMRAFFSQDGWIEFQYSLLPNSYLLDYSITSSNLNSFADTSELNRFEWNLKSFRNSKSVEYENRYTELTYGYENCLLYTSDAADE